MIEHPADPTQIEGYHAHIYYDPDTRAQAAALREAIGEAFTTRLGRWHDVPVGPHPVAMYQVAFGVDQFPRLVPFLMLKRDGLNVLVHPVTGDDYEDHADYALWLGTPLPLKLEALRHGRRELSPDERAVYQGKAG
jgi:aromatic ring-cleaving dioxygenase